MKIPSSPGMCSVVGSAIARIANLHGLGKLFTHLYATTKEHQKCRTSLGFCTDQRLMMAMLCLWPLPSCQPQTYIMYQILYVLFTSYQIVETHRLSLAYLLIWQKLRLMHLCRSVDVSTWRISHLIAKQTDFNWRKFSMFRIISPKLLELFHMRTISAA